MKFEEQSPNYNPHKYYPGQIRKSVGKYRKLTKLDWRSIYPGKQIIPWEDYS